MKKFLAGVATLAMVAGGTTSVMAQESAIGTGNADATLVAALAIAPQVDLSFGTISVTGVAGSVAVDAAGASTPDGTGATAVTGATAGTFDVTGPASQTYGITLPADATVVLTDTGAGTGTIAVNSFISNPTVADGGLLDGSGVETISVGATLTLAGGEVISAYAGTYDVTVDIP